MSTNLEYNLGAFNLKLGTPALLPVDTTHSTPFMQLDSIGPNDAPLTPGLRLFITYYIGSVNHKDNRHEDTTTIIADKDYVNITSEYKIGNVIQRTYRWRLVNTDTNITDVIKLEIDKVHMVRHASMRIMIGFVPNTLANELVAGPYTVYYSDHDDIVNTEVIDRCVRLFPQIDYLNA